MHAATHSQDNFRLYLLPSTPCSMRVESKYSSQKAFSAYLSSTTQRQLLKSDREMRAYSACLRMNRRASKATFQGNRSKILRGPGRPMGLVSAWESTLRLTPRRIQDIDAAIPFRDD